MKDDKLPAANDGACYWNKEPLKTASQFLKVP
ncbi:hypothetical protein BDD26_3848 [Xenorhabdus cabanillasii]|uniref:Uncharacterized protein n=2 Tax=Xenorhabdus TaxID=626 RepID=A0A3D9UHG6_9GAMM|nr:hypothetical protein Xbud_00456 [Xenorhabdus budapestensis]PHM78480.1 hypothetical protein Xcab_00865 [Xenorhabdus cabanillasii JM26]REF28882.1 hypothetical protein BDD26_3848 [Xenorhabdus cabanillasii]